MDFDAVRLTDVSRHFGRRRALSSVSLTLAAGDIVGLLGPNGAGKSTLIGVLATLVAPTGGEVRYGQHTAREGGSRLRQRIGLLAHELHLYPELTARQNLAFFAALYGLDSGAAVDAALERAGLTDRADDQVLGFSRGMRQRLALERALLHDPRLVLLDEPFTGLDDRAVGMVGDRLRQLARGGAIVLVATHDLDLADGLVTRVALMRDGGWSRTNRPRPACARGIGRWSVSRDVVSGPWRHVSENRAARAAEGRRDRDQELRDRRHDAVLRRRRACSSSRLRSSRKGRRRPMPRPRILWIAMRSPGPSRSAGRSSASATARRSGRCCSRRRRGRRSTSGSCSASCCLLGLTELLLVPVVALLFQAPLLARLPLLLPLLVCGTIGFAAVGTLFAAMLVRARTRDVMLPILLYPITIPVIIAGVRGTAALLASPPDEPTAIMWLAILLCFDVVFVTLSLWTFEPLMTE